MMNDKESKITDWDKWTKLISEEYGVNLDKTDQETEKQKRILEAALHTFAEKGFSGTSTSLIAERAGVAEATIFKHYKTKKGLLLRLVIPALGKVATPYLIRSVLKIIDQDKPLHQVAQEIYADRVHQIEANWEKIRLILVESLFHPELREALKNHVLQAIYEVMSERIEELKAAGRIRQDIPTHALIRSFMSIALGYLIARNFAPEIMAQGKEEEELAWMAEIALYGVAGPAEKELWRGKEE